MPSLVAAATDTLHGSCRCQSQRLGMRVGTKRVGFGLGVGEGGNTMKKPSLA
jgi:hypothetical protein